MVYNKIKKYNQRKRGTPRRKLLFTKKQALLKSYKAPIYLGLGGAPSVTVGLKAWGAFTITTPNTGITAGIRCIANSLNSLCPTDSLMTVNGIEGYFSLYNRAIVYASSIKLSYTANTNDDTTIAPIYCYVVPVYSNSGIPSFDGNVIHDILDMNMCKWGQVATGPDSILYLNNYVNIGAMFGDKDLKVDSDDHLSIKYNSGYPSYPVHWMIGINSQNSAAAVQVRGNMEVTYYVKFYEKKNKLNIDSFV